MKNTRGYTKVGLAALLSIMGIVAAASSAHAQGAAAGSGSGSGAGASSSTVSLDLRDTPIRTALEQLFKQAKVDFAIDPAVAGYVTLKLSDRAFEDALRLLVRSSSMPLTYTVEDKVYMVKPRRISTEQGPAGAPGPSSLGEMPDLSGGTVASNGRHFEVIQLIYADPYDLAKILGITMIPVGTRGMGGSGGQAGGGAGTGGANTGGTGGFPGGMGFGGFSGGGGNTGGGIFLGSGGGTINLGGGSQGSGSRGSGPGGRR